MPELNILALRPDFEHHSLMLWFLEHMVLAREFSILALGVNSSICRWIPG